MIDPSEGPPDSHIMSDGPGGVPFDYGFSMTLSPGFNSVGSQMPFPVFDLETGNGVNEDVTAAALYGQQQTTSSLSVSSDAVPISMRDDDGFFGTTTSLFPGGQQPDEHTSLFYSSDAVPTTSMGYFANGNSSSSTSDSSNNIIGSDPVADELGGEWERKLDFNSPPQSQDSSTAATTTTTDFEDFNEESEQGSDDIIIDDDSLLGESSVNSDQIMFMDSSVIPSPSTNSPPSPTEAVQVGGKLCHVSMDSVKGFVQDFRNVLLSNREKYQCSRPKTNKALGYKYRQTRELITSFYKEHVSRCPVPTRIYTAYSMLRGDYREEKNAGFVILAFNVNTLDDSHLHELTEIIDDKVRDWISCDILASVLAGMVKRNRVPAKSVLDWMSSNSVWRQRCCCITFSKLVHQPGSNYSDTVVSLCKSCLRSPPLPPLQTAAGVLFRELCTVDEALAIATMRDNLLRMDPSCIRTATEKLNEASKKELFASTAGNAGGNGGNLRTTTDSLVLPGSEESVWTARATLSCSDLPSPQMGPTASNSTSNNNNNNNSNSTFVVPVRNNPVSPGRSKTKRQSAKGKPSMTPPPSSPDILKPVPTPSSRRSLSSMRFDNSAFGGNNSMLGAVSAALGASIMRPPSTPQHQTGSHHVTPTHSVSPTPSTPTRKRPKPYNLSPALLKQNPTNATLAAAVTASASAVNLDRCAPPLQDHMISTSSTGNNGGNTQNNGPNGKNLSRAAALFYSNSSNVIGSSSSFGMPRQSLSPARTQSVQQISMQRRQLQLQHHLVPPRGMSPSRSLMAQPRSMSTPPYQFHRQQQPSKRK